MNCLRRYLNIHLDINNPPQTSSQPELVIISSSRVDNPNNLDIVPNSLLEQIHILKYVRGSTFFLTLHEEYDSGVSELLRLDYFKSCYDGEDRVAIVSATSSI